MPPSFLIHSVMPIQSLIPHLYFFQFLHPYSYSFIISFLLHSLIPHSYTVLFYSFNPHSYTQNYPIHDVQRILQKAEDIKQYYPLPRN